jgi:hypothetical protein
LKWYLIQKRSPASLTHEYVWLLGHVLGHLEEPVRAATFGVHRALRYALAVEVLHLLNDVVIVQRDRAGCTDCQRELVAGSGNPRIGGRGGRFAVVAACVRVDIIHSFALLPR